MAEEPKRPVLRVVSPEEIAAPSTELPSPAPALLDVSLGEPPVCSIAFRKQLEAADTQIPVIAGKVAVAATTLVDAAVGFYQQAVAHAPAGSFRCDTPAGMKSAEATRAWLASHSYALKQLTRHSAPLPSYDRAKDLRTAADLASRDLDRALATAKAVNLPFEDRHAHLLKDASTILIQNVSPQKNEEIVEVAGISKRNWLDRYWFGMDVLSGQVLQS